MNGLEASVAEIAGGSKLYEKRIFEMANRASIDQRTIHSIVEKMDYLDQRSGTHNHRIFNLKEKQNENTEDEVKRFLNSKMSFSHRVWYPVVLQTWK